MRNLEVFEVHFLDRHNSLLLEEEFLCQKNANEKQKNLEGFTTVGFLKFSALKKEEGAFHPQLFEILLSAGQKGGIILEEFSLTYTSPSSVALQPFFLF